MKTKLSILFTLLFARGQLQGEPPSSDYMYCYHEFLEQSKEIRQRSIDAFEQIVPESEQETWSISHETRSQYQSNVTWVSSDHSDAYRGMVNVTCMSSPDDGNLMESWTRENFTDHYGCSHIFTLIDCRVIEETIALNGHNGISVWSPHSNGILITEFMLSRIHLLPTSLPFDVLVWESVRDFWLARFLNVSTSSPPNFDKTSGAN